MSLTGIKLAKTFLLIKVHKENVAERELRVKLIYACDLVIRSFLHIFQLL